MDKDQIKQIIEITRETVEQMKIDDIEESPESAFDCFQCSCCGEEKILAGSLIYKDFLLCNDCVLLAEVSFALNKIKDIEELIKSMEEKRFDSVYASIFNHNKNENN